MAINTSLFMRRRSVDVISTPNSAIKPNTIGFVRTPLPPSSPPVDEQKVSWDYILTHVKKVIDAGLYRPQHNRLQMRRKRWERKVYRQARKEWQESYRTWIGDGIWKYLVPGLSLSIGSGVITVLLYALGVTGLGQLFAVSVLLTCVSVAAFLFHAMWKLDKGIKIVSSGTAPPLRHQENGGQKNRGELRRPEKGACNENKLL